MQTFISKSVAETQDIAKQLSAELSGGDVILFSGGLGMGKTAFVAGLCQGLGFSGDVSSPTFTVINEYRGGRINLCHVDAYRLESAEELFEAGFFEYIDNGWAAAVEWAENVSDLLPSAFLIAFERIDDTTRKITITRRKSDAIGN